MKKSYLESDVVITERKRQLNGAFAKSFLRGMVVTFGFMMVGEISDFFLTTENLTINIIVYAIAVLLSIFLLAQLVSKLLKPWGFKGFSKQPDENMTVIKFFTGAILGIFASFCFVALIVSLASLVIK